MDALLPAINAQPADLPPARLYLGFYQLSEAPFAITPDPDFLYTAGSHQQAIDKITYAIDSRMGFILLTGEVGTGKTTVCRALLDRLSHRAETVYVINPSVSGRELLTGILEDAHIAVEPDAAKKTLIDRLYRHLLSLTENKPFVVIIDDAQTMAPETLEDLRLLSNLETDKHKLIQVVLSGQPELIDGLGSAALRQLKQRIAIHCRLSALSAEETAAYIERRLFVAGNQGQVRFSDQAARLVHRAAWGIPRLINKICDYALTAGYVKDAPIINRSHVRMALGELNDLDSGKAVRQDRRLGLAAVAGVMLMAVLAAWMLIFPGSGDTTRQPLAPPPAADSDLQGTGALSGPAAPSAGKPLRPTESAVPPLTLADETVSTTPSTEKAAPLPAARQVKTKPASVDNAPRPAPYALQLGSFGTRQEAQRSVRRYGQKGIAAHWQPVNAGKWYRVIAGKFENLADARAFQQDHGLSRALIINSPLTVQVIPGQPTVSAVDIPAYLSQIGHDCLMDTSPTGDNTYYTGLFSSVGDASRIAEAITTSGRFVALVVER
jgi:general secretion pathway protein A